MPPQLTSIEIKQKELWRRYIAWEKTNPTKTEDINLFIKRGKSSSLVVSFLDEVI